MGSPFEEWTIDGRWVMARASIEEIWSADCHCDDCHDSEVGG